MKLISKTEIEYNDYAYSLTVKDNHNYFIGSKDKNVLSKNSQAEVRVLAKLANDKNLLKAFESGLDIHRYNAAMMWNKPAEQITGTERSMAKGVTFSLLYGTSISEFANRFTKGNINEAREIIASFFRSYPEVEKFIYEMHKHGALTDTIPTILGNPLYVNMPSWVKTLDKYNIIELVNNPYNRKIEIPFGRRLDEEEERKERAKFSKALRNSQNYCFTGDTKIKLLNGTSVKIEDLVGTNPYLYSYNLKTQEVEPAKASSVWKSKEVNEIYEIKLDNNKIIKVTGNHPFLLKSGRYKEVKDLKVGESIMPLYTKYKKGFRGSYEQILHPKINKNSCKWQYTHQLVSKFYLQETEFSKYIKKLHRHHVDHNPLNNVPENIVLLEEKDHISYHGIHMWKYNDTKEIRKKLSKSMSFKNKIRKDKYPEWDANQKKALSKLTLDRLKRTGSVSGLNKEQRSLQHKNIWKNNRENIVKGLKKGHNTPTAIKNHSDASKLREKNPEYIFNRLRPMVVELIENNLPYCTPEDWDSSIILTKIKPQARRKSKYINQKLGWDNFIEKINSEIINNHKIKSINKILLPNPIPVYDIEVPGNNNFALDAGVFVHNCIQGSSSLLAALAMEELQQHIEKESLSLKLECFTHDSCDADLRIKDLKRTLEILPKVSVDYLKEKYKIPMKVDYAIGVSNNKMIELSELNVNNDIITAEFEGTEESLILLKEKLEKYDKIVDFTIENSKEQMISIEDLFMTTNAYAKAMGTPFKQVEGKIKISNQL